MPIQSSCVVDLLFDFISSSNDGYGIFDAHDNLTYANYAFRDIFCINQTDDLGSSFTFASMVKTAFEQKRGLNVEAQNVEDWLAYVATVRRKRAFRIFEVDLVDGRWLLFSEQMLDTGQLLVHTKDMTRQKVLESELKQSMSTLHKLALTDELTQLANRRCFVESVDTELSRCKRNLGCVTMLVIDLDFFKKVNDTYGHQGGDAVLVEVADRLKAAIRQYDIVGRIGGEEFAIFLGSCELNVAREISERIRAAIEGQPVTYLQHDISITASIGMTSRDCDISFEQLYTEADEALYIAKENGRNRVELFGSKANSS